MSATGGTQNVATPASSDVVRVYKPATPGAGAHWTFTATEQFELDSIWFQLVTSAVVANRNVITRISDGTGAIVWQDQSYTATASSTTGLALYNGAGGQGAGQSVFQSTIPRLIIPIGWTIADFTANLDAADQFSLIAITGRIA